MEIWEYKDVKIEETKEQKDRRKEFNKGRQKRNYRFVPTKRQEVRFAKNRKEFYITLDNGDKYQIVDTNGYLQISRIDWDSNLIIIASGEQSIKIRKEKHIPYFRRPIMDSERSVEL